MASSTTSPAPASLFQTWTSRSTSCGGSSANLHSEGLTYQPPSVALRKDAHDALEAASRAGSEVEVRHIVETINARIREANSKGIAGPSLLLSPFDVERVVQGWREQREQHEGPADPQHKR